MKGKTILVHSCCAPCSSSVLERMIQDGYSPVCFFYNPNIHPHDEYKRRLEELISFAKVKNYNVVIQEDCENIWLESIKGYEFNEEGGKRCALCFELRLEKTALYAVKNNYEIFTITLTVSPHKNADVINEIGSKIGAKYNIDFLEADFKKNNGFKRSIEISKEYGLYRQKYCGCKFSFRNK